MSFEQLHFAVGVSSAFIFSLFLYKKRLIFFAPILMTVFGIFAMIPFFMGWSGAWTNVFFLYDIISNNVTKGQFFGYTLSVIMFSIVLGLQVVYLWRYEKNA